MFVRLAMYLQVVEAAGCFVCSARSHPGLGLAMVAAITFAVMYPAAMYLWLSFFFFFALVAFMLVIYVEVQI